MAHVAIVVTVTAAGRAGEENLEMNAKRERESFLSLSLSLSLSQAKYTKKEEFEVGRESEEGTYRLCVCEREKRGGPSSFLRSV